MPAFKLPQAISNFLWQEPSTRLQLNQHADQLAAFFPLLYYKRRVSGRKTLDKLKALYAADSNIFIDLIDEMVLTELIFDCLQEHARLGLAYIPLGDFNQPFANSLAKIILRAFNSGDLKAYNAWFHNYEQALSQYLLNELSLINHKVWVQKETSFVFQESLSYLWGSEYVKAASEKSTELMAKIGDAHAFLQILGASPQYENSLLSIIDVYNYKRSHKYISEVKSIIYSLFRPFHFIYYEYKDIAFYEKNAIRKFFRMLMPVLITLAFIVLVAVLLSPFALPELAFAATFIPTFLVGIALSSQYIWLKNNIYNSLREFFYGGHFKIPEFQVNQRMIETFVTEERAAEIRDFYIAELKRCDALEKQYKTIEDWSTAGELKLREENLIRRDTLCLEWYDIHTSKMAIDKVPVLVQAQIKKTISRDSQGLKEEIKLAENKITQSVTELSQTLQRTLIQNTRYEGPPQPISIRFTHKLFKPIHCLRLKENAEKLDDLIHEQPFKSP